MNVISNGVPRGDKPRWLWGNTLWATTTWWFPSETSPEAAGKTLLAASPELSLRRDEEEKERENHLGLSCSLVECSGAVCRDVSGDQVRAMQSEAFWWKWQQTSEGYVSVLVRVYQPRSAFWSFDLLGCTLGPHQAQELILHENFGAWTRK